MRIRKAKKGDISACVELHKQFNVEPVGEEEKKRVYSYLCKVLEDPDCVFFVAEEERVLGFVTISFHEWNGVAWVDDLFVKPGHHGMGIDSRLMEKP